MADYWKSNPTFFCKYCKIYIADEINQKRQHNEGLRHKGNVDRYIKELYKRGAQQKKDREEEEREMKRIEQAAHAAMGTAPIRGTSGAESATKKPRFQASLSAYSSAASMGLAPDEDEPFFLPGQRRTDQGEAGEWQVVEPSARPSEPDPPEAGPSRLRDNDDEAAEEAPSHRTLKERTAFLDDDLYDPGEIKLKRRPGESRAKKEESEPVEPAPRATFRPIRFGVKEESMPIPESKPEQATTTAHHETAPVIKREEPIDEKPAIEPEAAEPSLFKKRKRKV